MLNERLKTSVISLSVPWQPSEQDVLNHNRALHFHSSVSLVIRNVGKVSKAQETEQTALPHSLRRKDKKKSNGSLEA